MILGLVFALIVVVFQQQGGSAGPQAAIQQRAHDEYERHKQAATRINELAAHSIHSVAPGDAIDQTTGSFRDSHLRGAPKEITSFVC